MKINTKKNGFTLIEIIVAMAILGIILVAFLNVFASGYTTIFVMGQKTQAMAEAQEIIDAIYHSGDVTETEINDILLAKGLAYEKKDNYSQLISHPYNNINVRYCIETQTVLGINNDKVTILVFYQNGKYFVELTAIIP